MKDVAESDFVRRRRLEAINAETMKWYEPEDPREAQRRLQSAEKRVRAAMDKVPWNMMEKHLHSDEARQEYKEICDIIRSRFRDIPRLTTRQVVDSKVFMYAAMNHQNTSSDDLSIVKWMQNKLQLTGRITRTNSLVLGAGVVIGVAVGGMNFRRKNGGEVGGTGT
ncbi:hypothetical protein RHMOL_Rhmol10G0307900 [Rhododendron molle]|uniref:Uncharacterized protein n=1 Tax=Rhododendron molle TaxID=49168 RepID=A0ACC0M958_RHOML|nr:hypothetical protein RHMOL_Rhmol10G0307900 [Rhododendron molle]